MAKVQVVIALTIDGFLLHEDHIWMQWVKTDKNGFSYWRGRSTVILFPHYPLIDLSLDKDRKNNPCIYLAEISDWEGLELLRRLSTHRLVDEIILYRFPVTGNRNGCIDPAVHFPPGKWTLVESRTYKNGICRTIYRIKNG